MVVYSHRISPKDGNNSQSLKMNLLMGKLMRFTSSSLPFVTGFGLFCNPGVRLAGFINPILYFVSSKDSPQLSAVKEDSFYSEMWILLNSTFWCKLRSYLQNNQQAKLAAEILHFFSVWFVNFCFKCKNIFGTLH